MAPQHCKASTSTERGLQQGMYKNQLQELAQRSCFNLPSYSCIREGPDHAPRFKAIVNFNGEAFESPNYCSTLRQAEHAAAEVALNALSKRSPSQTFAARILDETGVCKNLLQETAQKAGVSLPVYTTVRAGPGRAPTFKCIVEIGGRVYTGEGAKTKKQAEKKAAMTAWSAIKQLPLVGDSEVGHHASSSKGSTRGSGWSNLRGGSKSRLNRDGSPSGQVCLSNISSEIGTTLDQDSRVMYNQREDLVLPSMQRPPSHYSAMSGVNSSFLLMPQKGAGSYSGRRLSHSPMQPQHHQRNRLAWQSYSDRYELRRPELMNDLQLVNREDDDWLESNHLLIQQQRAHQQQLLPCQRPVFQSQSERFELKQTLLDELYQREEEERSRLLNRDRMPIDYRNSSYSLFPDTNEIGDASFAVGEMPFSGGSFIWSEHSSYNGSGRYGDCSKPSYNCNTNINSSRGAASSRHHESYTSTTGGASSYLIYPYDNSGKAASLPAPPFISGYGGSVFDGTDKSHSSSNVQSAPASSLPSSSALSSIWSQWWGSHRGSNASSSVHCTPNPSSMHQVTNPPSSVHCNPNLSSMYKATNPSAPVHHTSNLLSCASYQPSSAVPSSFFGQRQVSSLAPPVKVRQIVPVCSAPSSRQTSATESSITFREHPQVPRGSSSNPTFSPVESGMLQVLEQLRL